MPSHASISAPAHLHHGDPSSLEAQWGIRKIVMETANILREGGTDLPIPVRQAWVAAVVKNPWVATGTDSDLINPPQRVAARLAKFLSDRILKALGGTDAIEAFGKGAIIGEAGEFEHGAALTHTPYFASNLRSFLGGTAVISFSDTRGNPGELLVVPLCEKNTGIHRDHYQSVRVRIPDAPRANEIVLVAAASTGPRPFPRVGDRSTDLPLAQELMNGIFA